MMQYTKVGEWVRAYGGRVNHKVSGFGRTDAVTGLNNIIFVCGKIAAWTQWGEDVTKPYCTKCKNPRVATK